jgi:hypothetical protein
LERREARESATRLGPRNLLILFVAVLVLGTWGFANAKINGHSGGFFDDLYQAVRLIPLHSGAEAQPVTWQLQVARFLAIAVDAVVLAAFGSFLLLGRDVPNRLRMWSAADHTIVCGAGVHGSRMARELASRHRVVVVDADEQSPGMKEPTGSREVHLVDDAVRKETLRRAGIARASRLIAVTGDDFVNSQIVSAVRTLARGGGVRSGLEVFVQIEDPALARSLEEGERSERRDMPRVHVFTPNALVAAALLGEGGTPRAGERVAVLADLEDHERPHLLLAGDHPLLEAVILGELRRRRARILRNNALSGNGSAESEDDETPAPFRISLIGPRAIVRVERVIRSWSPEPEVMELEAEDVDTHDESSILANRWIRDRRVPAHCLVACEEELDSIELTVTMSRILDPSVPLTRVTSQPESELDRQLHSRTRHRVRSISDLAWGGEGSGVDWISAGKRLSSALVLENVRDPEVRAKELLDDRELGIHSDSAPRVSPGNRPLVQALLEAASPDAECDGNILLSALVGAGVSINLEAGPNLRRAAEHLAAANGTGHDSFRAWCEYARHAPDEMLERDPRPVDPLGASIVGLRLAARGRTNSLSLASPNPVDSNTSRIAIFAGAAASMPQETCVATQALLTRAFRHYDGLILTGGSTVGLAVAVRAAARVVGLHVVGYAPAGYGEPGDGVVLRETATDGTSGEETFSEREPMAMWTDILAGAFNAADVRVVAFPGGQITRSELVLARALGAKVVWLDPSSDAEMALEDDLPLGAEGVLEMPSDPMTLRAFLAWPVELPAGWPTETIARYLHNDYREKHRDQKPPGDPALAPWERLLPALRRSNLAAAADIPNKLQVIGKRPTKGGRRLDLSRDEVELLAELEHGRYNYERLSAGWQLGERQVLRLVNPSLMPWDNLTDQVKQWDRDSVCNIDPALAQAGWGVEGA